MSDMLAYSSVGFNSGNYVSSKARNHDLVKIEESKAESSIHQV
jgi:hypothetical protein